MTTWCREYDRQLPGSTQHRQRGKRWAVSGDNGLSLWAREGRGLLSEGCLIYFGRITYDLRLRTYPDSKTDLSAPAGLGISMGAMMG